MYYTSGTPSPGREKGTTRENVYACLRVSAHRTIQEEYTGRIFHPLAEA